MSADLETVRSELRRRGYLSPGVGRFLLQDALAPRPAGRTFGVLSAKVGLLGGVVFALGGAVALLMVNRGSSPVALDLVALFVHLLPPASLAVGLGFLVLSGLFTVIVRGTRQRRTESWALGAALLVAAGLAGTLWQLRIEASMLSWWQRGLAALAAASAGLFLVRVLYHGLLSLSLRLGDADAGRWPLTRRGLRSGLALAAVAIALPIAFSARSAEPPAAPASLPSAPGDRVVMIGIDGVLAQELEYLLARGELPALAERVGQSGLARYRRPVQAPAVFWTTVATGTPPEQHEVASLDTFRPLLVGRPLATVGPVRGYLARILVPLGLAEHRPLVSSRRRTFAFWELASRGGEPVVATNWWGTYPAPVVPGTMIAHGAWGLLAEGAPGAVEPAGDEAELRAAQAASAGTPLPPELAASLGPAAADELARRALWPDQFYREAFGRRISGVRAGALYLPALDLAADGWRGGALAFGDLLRRELAAFDHQLAQFGSEFDTVIVVFDPGRRLDAGSQEVEGRVLLWRRSGCTPAAAEVTVTALAATALRALGLPQSAELPEPPPGCVYARAPETVTSYGRRSETVPGAAAEGEYLENLRSLGYL